MTRQVRGRKRKGKQGELDHLEESSYTQVGNRYILWLTPDSISLIRRNPPLTNFTLPKKFIVSLEAFLVRLTWSTFWISPVLTPTSGPEGCRSRSRHRVRVLRLMGWPDGQEIRLSRWISDWYLRWNIQQSNCSHYAKYSSKHPFCLDSTDCSALLFPIVDSTCHIGFFSPLIKREDIFLINDRLFLHPEMFIRSLLCSAVLFVSRRSWLSTAALESE